MSNDNHTAEATAIAASIERYTLLFQEQVEKAGGWPRKFVFPEPTDDAEREALRLLVAEIERETGVRPRIINS